MYLFTSISSRNLLKISFLSSLVKPLAKLALFLVNVKLAFYIITYYSFTKVIGITEKDFLIFYFLL
jgi:hypothetical protein